MLIHIHKVDAYSFYIEYSLGEVPKTWSMEKEVEILHAEEAI